MPFRDRQSHSHFYVWILPVFPLTELCCRVEHTKSLNSLASTSGQLEPVSDFLPRSTEINKVRRVTFTYILSIYDAQWIRRSNASQVSRVWAPKELSTLNSKSNSGWYYLGQSFPENGILPVKWKWKQRLVEL